MAYNIELPDGSIVEDIPDDVPLAEAKKNIAIRFPQFAPKPVPQSTERTFGEAITDPLLGLVKGAGAMAQLPGQLYGLATGDFDTAAMRGPEQLQEYAKSLQSEGLHVREALRDKAMSEAEKRGIAAEFYTAITQTLKDPALISTFITEQVPEMLPMLLTGGISKLFTTGASQVAKLGAKEAAANAAKIATRTGIATGAVQQGADVGSDTYKEALDLAKAQYPNKSPEEIQDIALSAARSAALEAGIVSLGAQNLPGAKAIERRMAGRPGEGRIRSAVGEAAGEMLEEGGGKFASNVNLQQIDPERSLTAGVGSAAGLGAIGGGAMGAVIGRRAPEPELMPGQNYGESLAQAANRLQAEIRENQKLIQPVERAITAVTQAPIDPVVAPFINPPQGSLFSEGNLNVGTANAAPGGEGTLLAGVPGTGGTAAGVDTTQPDGVVPTGQDVAGTAGGEGTTSTSVEPVILQNRDRASPASIEQMQDISARPDYTRLGFSRDITFGAPVVFGGNIPAQQFGKVDVVAAGSQKIPVQYAVMDANDVVASNTVDGSAVPEYSTAVDKTRAVGGNGRIAGLQSAYQNNNAAAYNAELLTDTFHGISPDVIKGIKNPVLVRVMPASEVTKNIGDLTNTSGILRLSPTEQAKNDSKRVDLDSISYNADGDVTDQSVVQFIQAMPQSERGEMIDANGATRQARDRLHAAIFASAYQNDQLIRLYAQAVDPDAKNVLNALSQAAPQMARLNGAGALDFRNEVVAAAEQVVNAKRAGISTPDMIAQVQIGENPNVHNILTLFANNIRSAKRMAEALKEAANYAYHHANTEEQDMFGDVVPKPTKEDITQGIKEGKEYPKLSLAKRVPKEQIDLGLTGEEEQQKKAKAKFERVATAEAPERIAEKKEQFKNILGKILSNMGLKDVAVKLMDDIESEKAEGSYAEKLIKIALNADKPVRTLRHEAIHALKELGFFSDNQWKVLTKQANDVWIDKYLKNRGVGGGPLKEGEQSRYDAYMEGEEFKADPNAIIEEAIADAFGDFDATKSPPGMIQAILKRMRDFFDGLKRALNGAGFLTSDQAVEQLFGKIERGELKAGETKAGGEKLSLAVPKPLADRGITQEHIDLYKDMSAKQRLVEKDTEFATRSEKIVATKAKNKFFNAIEKLGKWEEYYPTIANFVDLQKLPKEKLSLRVPGYLYHRSNLEKLASVENGDKFVLQPGPQGAEGEGVYFSQDEVVRETTAEGTARKPQTAVVVIKTPLRNGWYVSKTGKTIKYGKPRTWHTENKTIDLQVVDVKTIEGEKVIFAKPISNWVSAQEKLSLRAPDTKEFKQFFGDSKDARAKLSLRDKLGLYSELENKIEAVGPNQAPAPQWKAMIKGMVQKGVKPEEIEWSGVNDYLDLQEGKVTKAALLEYLKEGGVKVEETTLQETAPPELMWKLVKNDDFKEHYETTFINYKDEIEKISMGLKPNGKWWIYSGNDDAIAVSLSKNDAENYAVAYAEENGNKQRNGPKYNYGQLILPGGTNYREVLLKLPIQEPDFTVDDFIDKMAKKYGKETLYNKVQENHWELKRDFSSLLNKEDKAQFEKIKANQKSDVKEFKSGHWDQPNVLAHIRINDRVDVDGKKVLFVEEVQSDWGQEGKREGFISDLTPITPTEWETVDRHDIYNTREEAEKDIATYPPAGDGINYYSPGEVEFRHHIRLLPGDKQNRYEIVEQVRTLATKTGRFPKAPFVTKTEGWLNLALKRIMVLAAEGNYDKVAFINGKQSAKRYNLAAYIDSIDYEKDDQGTYEFVATDKEGKTVYSKEEISLSEIEELVGKDIAKKIEAGEGDTSYNESSYNNWHTLSNVDLEVGEGKGMKVFYDQIVPIALKKLLPKVGGKELVNVDIKETLQQRRVGQTLRNVLHQPGFDVTPEMKQKVETTGLPKFSLRNTFSGQINAAVDRTTTFREETKWGDKLLGWLSPTSKSEFRAAMINRYNELGIYDRRRAEKMGGFGLLADASAESAALFSDLGSSLTAAIMGPNGGAPVYANGITTVSDFGGTVKGPLEIFAELERLGKGDIEIYRYYQVWAGVKRAERLMPSHANPQGTEINFKQSDIPLAKEIEKRFPEFVAIQKEWIKYNDKLAQYLVDTGVIGKEAKKEWVKYGDYVPFYRQVNDIETVGPKLLQAIAGVKGPKKIKGDSTAPLADFLETVIRNTQAAVQMGIKNVAAQRAVLVAMDLNAPGQTDVIEPLNFVSSKPDTVTILVDGQQRSFRSNDTLWLSAITSLNLPDVPFVGVFTGPANLLRALVTKDPGFMLANMMRDSMQAMIASDYKTVNPATTLMNFAATLAGSSPEFKALMNAGVVGGNEYTKDIVHSGKAFAKDLRKAAGQMTTAETLLSPVTGLWDALERGTTASDAATREQIYKEVLKRTTSPAYPNGNMAEAIYRAMEVMNFNRKGNSAIIRFLTGAIPFFNARIQGLDVLYRAGFGIGPDKKSAAAIQKQFFIRGATMFAMSCMYWTMTHDDDDYKNQEQETKDNYWLLPSLGVKIPIPFEIGILFKVIPERIMAAYFGTDTAEDFTRSMKRQLVNTLDVNWLMPQTVKPLLETVTNHSFFTDRPIIGQGMETIEEGYQAGANTSKIAADIGKSVGYSPMKIDHLVSGYTGTMGMYAFNLLDAIYKMNDDKTYASKRFEQTPVLKRFLVDPNARGTVTAYYETKNAADSAVRTAALMERTMNYEEWGPYYKENIKVIATQEYLLDLEKTMKELREMRMQIVANKADPDEKRDALANLNRVEAKLTANIQIVKKNMK